jgi:hypothetical protein
VRVFVDGRASKAADFGPHRLGEKSYVAGCRWVGQAATLQVTCWCWWLHTYRAKTLPLSSTV